jgi:NADP-dependent 3-hydroxy acid dehydrogenase YdfG
MARRVDVANRGEMKALGEAVHERVAALDILVNNAGVYVTGGILDLSLEDWDWVLGIDLWGVIHGVHFFVPKMVERAGEGHVVNVSSMYGYWVGPGVIGYLTAKFGVFGFSEALREDLRGTRIGVSTLCPGVIKTNLVQATRFRNTKNEDAQRSHLEETYRRRAYGPEKVARAIVDAIKRNRGLVLVSPESKIMYQIHRLCPPLSRIIARRAARRMFQR